MDRGIELKVEGNLGGDNVNMSESYATSNSGVTNVAMKKNLMLTLNVDNGNKRSSDELEWMDEVLVRHCAGKIS